jgi:hypothetical protein
LITLSERTLAFWFGICFILCAQVANAQPTDRFRVADTSSPRDTLRSFIEAVNESHELIQRTQFVDRNSTRASSRPLRVQSVRPTLRQR